MKKQTLKLIFGLFLGGFAAGITIGMAVNIIISYCIGEGSFLPVMPQLERLFKNEINAVLFENLLFGLIGVVFAEASFVFTIESLGFLHQCILHLIITAVFYMPFVYLCYLPHNLKGLISMIANIIFTYALTWFLRYMHDRKNIDELNRKIQEDRRNDGD